MPRPLLSRLPREGEQGVKGHRAESQKTVPKAGLLGHWGSEKGGDDLFRPRGVAGRASVDDPRSAGGSPPQPEESRARRWSRPLPAAHRVEGALSTRPAALKGLGPRLPLGTLRPPPLPAAQAGPQLLSRHGDVTQQSDLAKRGSGR